jgi:hypothetical protein
MTSLTEIKVGDIFTCRDSYGLDVFKAIRIEDTPEEYRVIVRDLATDEEMDIGFSKSCGEEGTMMSMEYHLLVSGRSYLRYVQKPVDELIDKVALEKLLGSSFIFAIPKFRELVLQAVEVGAAQHDVKFSFIDDETEDTWIPEVILRVRRAGFEEEVDA